MHRLYEPEPFSIDEFKALAGIRKIYIWGAGNQGRGIASILRSNDITLKGFLDASDDLVGTEVQGMPVFAPDTIYNAPDASYIVVASFFYEQEIVEQLKQAGLHEPKDFVTYSRLKPHDYSVDISGACNLRCLSCPRATRSSDERTPGFMTLEVFKKVIQKITKEDPFVGNIQLYQWGEPTLNKDLPQMIEYARSQGINCAISSNLNVPVDFTEIIEARPEWLRVSASGCGLNYEVTHTGGKWEQFEANFRTVCALRKNLYPAMKMEVFYHIYKHSLGRDIENFKALCRECEVEFHPVYAYLISLDDVLAYQEGTSLPAKAAEANELLFFNLDDGLEQSLKDAHFRCDTFRSIHINWDLSVSNCMMYYYPQGNTACANYLETPIADIMSIRKKSALCKRCLKKGMHRYCATFSTMPISSDNVELQPL